ncbi:hypothetical protein GJ496_008635 [Pomphorhynchus laevis]|nr:hypothetical protein GJ496_008635 [Pomphorhynchus laevis]
MASDITESSVNAVNVLGEQEFTEKVRQIIKRDFFPDLDIIRKQNIYLDAIKEMNVEAISSIEDYIKKLESNETIDEDSPKMSLDEFLSNNTSCDNIAFERVIEKLERADKVKPRYAWLYENDAQAALESSVAYDESGQIISERNLSRPVDTWSFKNKNSLMYYPDGHNKNAPRDREIRYLNTRLPDEYVSQCSLKPATYFSCYNELSASSGRREMLKRTFAGSILDTVSNRNVSTTTPTKPSSWLAAKYANKKRALDTLVPSTPTPKIGPDQSPFMTWGKVENTPVAQNTPSFRIAETPERDVLARKLAEEAGADFRKRKQTMLRYLSNQRTPGSMSVGRSGQLSTPRSSMIKNIASKSTARRFLADKDPGSTSTCFLTSQSNSPTVDSPSMDMLAKKDHYTSLHNDFAKQIIKRAHNASSVNSKIHNTSTSKIADDSVHSPGILRIVSPKQNPNIL